MEEVTYTKTVILSYMKGISQKMSVGQQYHIRSLFRSLKTITNIPKKKEPKAVTF